MPFTQEFVESLIRQNQVLIEQNNALIEQVETLNKIIEELNATTKTPATAQSHRQVMA